MDEYVAPAMVQIAGIEDEANVFPFTWLIITLLFPPPVEPDELGNREIN